MKIINTFKRKIKVFLIVYLIRLKRVNLYVSPKFRLCWSLHQGLTLIPLLSMIYTDKTFTQLYIYLLLINVSKL